MEPDFLIVGNVVTPVCLAVSGVLKNHIKKITRRSSTSIRSALITDKEPNIEGVAHHYNVQYTRHRIVREKFWTTTPNTCC